MSKSNRANTANDAYSHPLVKDIYHPVNQSDMTVIPSYVPIKPNNSDRISTKIVRHAEILRQNNEIEILMTVNPFAEAVDSLPVVEQISQCQHCQTKMNRLTSVENHTQMKCNLCGRTTHINLTNYDELIRTHGYRVQQPYKDNCNQKNGNLTQLQKKRRRVCFLIQHSQYNYEAHVHNSIFSCLKAIESEQFQIAFIFYNDRYVTFLLPATLEIVKVALLHDESFSDWTNFPVNQNDLFVAIGESLTQLQQIVDAVMYQAFLIKQTLVEQVTKMVKIFMDRSVEVKCFVTTYNSSIASKTQQITNVFKQKQNTLQSNLVKKLPFLTQTQQPTTNLITLNPNLNFFVLTPSTNYRQVIRQCQYNLVKIYNPKDRTNLENQLYYDLYQNLTHRQLTNVQISVRTSKNVSLQISEDHISTLYGNIRISKERYDSKMNKYLVTVNQADHRFSLPLRFVYNRNCQSQQKPFIQLEYCNPNNQQSVVLNLRPKVELGQKWMENVDDEVVFSHQLRTCLSTWNEQSYKELKQSLLKQYLEVVRLFIDHNGSNIVFPKNWKHYLLYSHLLQQKISQGSINQYQLYKLLNKNIESFSKYFYYRAYKLEENLVKNIKFTKSVFDKYDIVFVENGEYLFMVMREPPVQTVKQIFGYYDTTSSLANQHLELPELETNQKYRNAIQSIRNLHESNFLPLKIIDYEACLFQILIESKLYEKQKHMSFLRKLWREA